MASVVMTVGADGVLYDGEEGQFQLPAFKVKAVDTTAAGDTFCGYFLAAVSAGKSVQTALQEASAASALAVSRTGAAPSGADSRRSTGISAQARINHRKRGKLNLRKECIGMHITIERDGCISCGLCEGTCPSVFRIAEDGLAEVHHQPETAEEQAARRRPQAAVRWPSFMSAENVSVKADRRVRPFTSTARI